MSYFINLKELFTSFWFQKLIKDTTKHNLFSYKTKVKSLRQDNFVIVVNQLPNYDAVVYNVKYFSVII